MTISIPLRHTARRSASALAAASLLLGLAGLSASGCSTVSGPDSQATALQLAPGWQEHASPLFNLGPGPTAGSSVWLVPGTLPHGSYEVVSRHGDHAEVLDGRGFRVDSGVNKEIRLILPFTAGSIEAVDQQYVLDTSGRKSVTR